VNLDADTCYRAIVSRDRRFDGRFVLAVKTTGVYCRPGCPAPLPKRVNSFFYACPAAAEDAGYRPCRRCRPETVAGTPAWSGTSVTVSRALRLILDGALDAADLDALAGKLGVGERHLRRLFAEHLGTAPQAVARTRRVHFARRLIDETDLPFAELAALAGFASLRSFNHSVKATFGRTPTELRHTGRAGTGAGMLTLKLPYRAPLDWDALVAYFRVRATPGVESIASGAYRRTFALGAERGVLAVRPLADESALELRIRSGAHLLDAVARASRLFDLDADPAAIAAHLSGDALLRPLVAARPGLRVPGAWDPFEVLVRAVLGQQVSVKAATTLAGRLARRFGEPLAEPVDDLTHHFPQPSALAGRDLAEIGLPSARARALSGLATAVADGRLRLDAPKDLDDVLARFEGTPGVGPWTAHYVALRAFKEPDAFPASDLGLRKALGTLDAGGRGEGMPSEKDAERRSQAWRPFRAYAALHLWNACVPSPK
jgi:AraC family transcriptional regulator of adaptative response / DNA-3-methyladenine glycosylase II